MINQRSIIALFLLSFSTACLGLADAKVTGNNLNVRKFPNGELVEQLRLNHPVRVVKEQDGWSQIVYTTSEGGLTAFGWVSSDYLEYAFEAETTECVIDPMNGQDLCLATMEPDLQCNRQNQSLGYSNCSIDVRYELSGNGDAEKELGISCVISLITKKLASNEWHNLTHSTKTSHSVSTTIRESLDLNIEFPKEQPISYVRVDSTECELILDAVSMTAEPS